MQEDEWLAEHGIRNGIGPEIEQRVTGSVGFHRVRQNAFVRLAIELGLRNPDTISAPHVDFTHAMSIELERNRNGFACSDCQTGKCKRDQHNSTY